MKFPYRSMTRMIGALAVGGGLWIALNVSAADARSFENEASGTSRSVTADSVDVLNSMIASLRNDTLRLSKELRKAVADRKKLNENKRLNDSIRRLNRLIADIRAAHEDDLGAMAALRSQDSVEIARLREELSQLGDFKARWLAEVSGKALPAWMSTPYAAIDVTALKGALAEYEPYASENSDVEHACTELRRLLNEAMLYRNAEAALNSPYDSRRVAELAGIVGRVLPTVSDPAKAAELKRAGEGLEGYGNAVETFRRVIAEVNRATRDDSGAAAVFTAKAKIAALEENNGDITEIKSIAWLAGQFAAYEEALYKDPHGENAAADAIKALGTE